MSRADLYREVLAAESALRQRLLNTESALRAAVAGEFSGSPILSASFGPRYHSVWPVRTESGEEVYLIVTKSLHGVVEDAFVWPRHALVKRLASIHDVYGANFARGLAQMLKVSMPPRTDKSVGSGITT